MNLTRQDLLEIRRRLVDFFKKQETVSDKDERQSVWSAIERASARSRRQRFLKIALPTVSAAAAAVAGVIIFIGNEGSPAPQDFSSSAVQLLALTQRSEDIRLILSSDEEFKVERGATVEYRGDAIAIDDELVSKAEEPSSSQLDKLIVPFGTYTSLVLADGTRMHVNSGTTVVFPRSFKPGRREIFVDGEVFLEVAKDEKAPFVVTTYNFNVEVTGTVFNVNAYSDFPDSQEVVLAQGSVNVRSKSGKVSSLTPDTKAVISGEGDISRTKVNAGEYTYWTQGILYLNIASTRDILLKLSRYYGAQITCDPEIADVELVGKVDLEGGVWEALNRVADAGRFNLFSTAAGYELKPRI